MIPFYTSNQGKALEERVEAVEARPAPVTPTASFLVESIDGTWNDEFGQWTSTDEVELDAFFQISYFEDTIGSDSGCLVYAASSNVSNVSNDQQLAYGMLRGVKADEANTGIPLSVAIYQLTDGRLKIYLFGDNAMFSSSDEFTVQRISLQIQ